MKSHIFNIFSHKEFETLQFTIIKPIYFSIIEIHAQIYSRHATTWDGRRALRPRCGIVETYRSQDTPDREVTDLVLVEKWQLKQKKRGISQASKYGFREIRSKTSSTLLGFPSNIKHHLKWSQIHVHPSNGFWGCLWGRDDWDSFASWMIKHLSRLARRNCRKLHLLHHAGIIQ